MITSRPGSRADGCRRSDPSTGPGVRTARGAETRPAAGVCRRPVVTAVVGRALRALTGTCPRRGRAVTCPSSELDAHRPGSGERCRRGPRAGARWCDRCRHGHERQPAPAGGASPWRSSRWAQAVRRSWWAGRARPAGRGRCSARASSRSSPRRSISVVPAARPTTEDGRSRGEARTQRTAVGASSQRSGAQPSVTPGMRGSAVTRPATDRSDAATASSVRMGAAASHPP